MELLASVRVVCREQPRIQALDHVRWSIDAFADFSDVWTAENALKTREPRLIARVAHYVAVNSKLTDEERHRLVKPVLEYAAAKGDLHLIQDLHQSIPLHFEVALIAALRGDLPLLRWIQSIEPTVFHNESIWAEQAAYDVAAELGQLDIVRWLVESFPDCSWSLKPAVVGGHLDVIQWLHENAHVEMSPPRTTILITVQDLETRSTILKWGQFIQECLDAPERPLKGTPADSWCESVYAMDWAAQSGRLDILEWLEENRNEGCSPHAIMLAAEAGNMEVLRWLHSHYSDQWTPRAMDLAAENGHLEIVQWIHENRSEGCTTSAMDYAASKGSLEVVKWLHDNRSEGCTTLAMNSAAKNGHLNVVQWLHHFRSEGCTTYAMDLVAEKGNLDMVKWLHANRTEGCTTNAMDAAALSGDLEMVKWLHFNRTEGCTTLAVDMAAANGHLDVLKFLAENRAEGGTFNAVGEAEENRHREVVRWLDECNVELAVPLFYM